MTRKLVDVAFIPDGRLDQYRPMMNALLNCVCLQRHAAVTGRHCQRYAWLMLRRVGLVRATTDCLM